MRAIDARPLAATSAALTTGGARAAAWCWSSSSATIFIDAIADGCQDALGELCGSDEALCLSSQLLTLEQITRSSSVER
mgnify:CR=1 FL=1